MRFNPIAIALRAGYSCRMYLTIKFLHVLFAVLIFGNLLILTMLVAASRKKTRAELSVLIPWAAKISPHLSRSSLLVAILGVVLTQMQWSFKLHWISASFTFYILYLAVAFVGVDPALKKAASALLASPQASGTTDVMAHLGRARVFLIVELLAVTAMIALMVYKP